MKNLRRILGAVPLGLILLTGCGKEPADRIIAKDPVVISSGAVEEQGQNRQAQDGQTGQGQDGQTGQAQDGQTGQGQDGQTGQGQDGQTGQAQDGQGQAGQSGQIRTRLTLGTCGTPWELTQAVDAYNARRGDVFLELVDYMEEEPDYDTAQERLKLDLTARKGTDILWVGDLEVDELGYAGFLADLNPYLTQKNREIYLTNILECAQTGSALYELAATFGLAFLAGDSGKLGAENGWTMEEMLETFRAAGKDAGGLGGVGVNTAQALVLHAIEDFVDWDAGKADFCRQDFYEILKFAGSESGWAKASPESVASGTHLAVQSGISHVTDIQYLNWLLGEGRWVAKGWPGQEGTGVTVSFWNSFAVSASCSCPEGAWDFLTYYMTLDWLEDYGALHPERPRKTYQSVHGLPLNRRTFEKMLKWSTIQQYDEAGEPVPFYFGEEPEPDFYANSSEDVEKIREITALADGRTLSERSFVGRIIGEEIGGYKAGALTAEQTALKIQNRVQLYLDERKR